MYTRLHVDRLELEAECMELDATEAVSRLEAKMRQCADLQFWIVSHSLYCWGWIRKGNSEGIGSLAVEKLKSKGIEGVHFEVNGYPFLVVRNPQGFPQKGMNISDPEIRGLAERISRQNGRIRVVTHSLFCCYEVPGARAIGLGVVAELMKSGIQGYAEIVDGIPMVIA